MRLSCSLISSYDSFSLVLNSMSSAPWYVLIDISMVFALKKPFICTVPRLYTHVSLRCLVWESWYSW